MNIKELLNIYGDIYQHLYDNYSIEYLGIVEREFANQFEEYMEEDPVFRDAVMFAADERGDIFTSDRECASILLAYLSLDQREMLKQIAIDNGSI